MRQHPTTSRPEKRAGRVSSCHDGHEASCAGSQVRHPSIGDQTKTALQPANLKPKQKGVISCGRVAGGEVIMIERTAHQSKSRSSHYVLTRRTKPPTGMRAVTDS